MKGCEMGCCLGCVPCTGALTEDGPDKIDQCLQTYLPGHVLKCSKRQDVTVHLATGEPWMPYPSAAIKE